MVSKLIFSEVIVKSENNLEIYNGNAELIPKFHQYFPETSDRGAILVTELLGENLSRSLYKFKRFSAVSVIRIGLQAVNLILYFNFNLFDTKETIISVGCIRAHSPKKRHSL